jgi:hypothetical protein
MGLKGWGPGRGRTGEFDDFAIRDSLLQERALCTLAGAVETFDND